MQRYVVGAYLLADMEDYTLVKLTGKVVDIMCDVNARYKAFATMENGKKVLYMKLLRVLYRYMWSALYGAKLSKGA